MMIQSICKRSTAAIMLVMALFVSPALALVEDGNYPAQRKAAIQLVQLKQYDQAVKVFEKMAQDATLPAHKNDACEQAAMAAMAGKDFDHAMTLARQILDEQISLMVQMRLLSMNKDAKGVLAIGNEKDLTQWADVTAGEALYLRGKAYEDTAAYDKAAADIEEALKRLGQGRLRSEAGLALGDLYRENLKSPDKAIAAYQAVLDGDATRDYYGWIYATALINKAMTQADASDTDAALETLKQIDLSTRISGYWAAMLRQAHAKIRAQRGEKQQAIDLLTEALTLPKVPDFLKNNLQKQLDGLQPAVQ